MKLRPWIMAAVLALTLTACGNNRTNETDHTSGSPAQPNATNTPAETTDSTYQANSNGEVEDRVETETTTPDGNTGSDVGDDMIDAVEDAGTGVAEGAKDVIDGAENAVDDAGNAARDMTNGTARSGSAGR